MNNFDDDCRHVITAETFRRGKVFGAAVVEQVLHPLLQLCKSSFLPIIVFVDSFEGVGDCLLRGFDVPDTITGEQHELCVRSDRHDLDVREW